MTSSHQNWQYLGGNGFTGSYATTGGGGTPVTGRSEIDFARMGMGKTPAAEYPDGYLGTIRSRRDDRGIPTDTVLDSLKNRQNQRPYQRGVHKGERIDPGQYFWPQGLEADRRLLIPAQEVNNDGAINKLVPRYAPNTVLAPPPALVNDGKADIVANEPVQVSTVRANTLSRLKPKWG
jgi:hypothetical protein